MVEANTYLYYIQTKPSRPSADAWVPYDDAAEQTIRDDFRRLWATNFLDDLSIEVKDYAFPNGVEGKIVIYNMEERQRVKIIDYVGSKQVESTKIDEKLREENVTIRMDTFLDDSILRRTKVIVRGMLAEKGYLDSQRDARDQADGRPGQDGARHVQHRRRSERSKIRDIDFVGNKAIGDGTLKRRMKETKELWPFSFITGRGVYKDTKYEEDAEKVQAYYRDRGYITTQVGNPEVRTLETAKDGSVRFIQLRDSRLRGAALQDRQVRLRREQGGQARGAAHALQGQGRRVTPRRTSARAWKSRAKSTAPSATGSSPAIRCSSGSTSRIRRPPPKSRPPRPRSRRRRRDDAHAGGRAVLRQPHHVRGEQHHARSRDPAAR